MNLSLDKIRFAFRALEDRNYRLLFWPQTLSLCGSWMQHTAQGWLVYRLSGSTAWLGFITFLNLFPIFLFGLWAGAIGDRYPRKPIVIATNILAAIQALALGVLAVSDHISLPLLAFLAFGLGVLTAFEIPNRQAYLVDLVPAEALSSAMALNSSALNLSRLLGPLLAGALIAWKGEGVCFLINALTYAPVLIGLVRARSDSTTRKPRDGTLWGSLRAGIGHLWRRPVSRSALALVACTSFFGVWFPSFLPAIAKEIYGGGPLTLGLLLSAVGSGSLAGAFHLARLESGEVLRRRISWAALGFAAGLFVFARLESVGISLIILFGLGYAMVTFNVGANTLTQSYAPRELRSRISSVYTVSLLGIGPVGALAAGGLADRVGLSPVLTVGSLGCLTGALLLFPDLMRRDTDLEPDQREMPMTWKDPSAE